jgi:hypothetical protein
MSFLDTNYSGIIATRLTQKGRESIANGNFVISHFAVGDSEYSYVDSTTGSLVFSPFDDYGNVKYPIQYTSGSTPYGVPISEMTTVECSNVMGPAGFVSGSLDDDFVIKTTYETISSFAGLTNQLNVINGSNYGVGDFVTLVLNPNMVNTSLDTITGDTNSQIYKITATGSTTVTLDRTTQLLPGNNVILIPNEEDFQNPLKLDTTEQQNSWSMNVVWDSQPIGLETSDRPITGYTSNVFVGTKEFLGYKTSEGQTINTGTTITNTLGESVIITPEEQKCIAILHYSKNGDSIDPDRFFKYDDHISTTNTGYTPPNEPSLSDEEYFLVHMPFLLYHRNTGTTVGATFKMGTVDKEYVSSKNSRFVLNYRDLLDENNFRVGKIFYNQQVIVFDDEEIVATLDYKSNRRFTLPAPKVSAIITNNPITDLTTGKTMWVSYVLSYTGDTNTNSLPCNYFMKVTGGTTPHSVSVKFNSGEFQYLQTSTGNTVNGQIANEFYLLFQITNNNEYPVSHEWSYYKQTGITLNGAGLIESSQLSNNTFTINESDVSSATGSFNLGDFMTSNFTGTTGPYFGDEQPFPGSINAVRATEIQQLSFKVNLPADKFTTSVNPTHTSGDLKITEVALLNSNKDTLIMGKLSAPLTRSGAQVFMVQLDF